MDFTIQDIRDNLAYNESGFDTNTILNFIESNMGTMEFTCIDDNVDWDMRTFKDNEDSTEQLCLLNVYIDDVNL